MSNHSITASSLRTDFEQLSAVLARYQQYWQLVPFCYQQLPWHDKLNYYLLQLSEDELAQIDQQPQLQQQYFQHWFPELFALPAILQPVETAAAVAPLPFWLSNGIGGRKLQQIDAFCQHWQPSELPVLEWCAGKGHLGRMLAYRYGQQVTSVEWQQQLCDEGQQLALQHQLPQRFVQADVLAADSKLLAAQQQAVALHACGQLHITLLQQAARVGCHNIQLVPCCYHLIPDNYYQPLSDAGQKQNLNLSQHDLKLVVQGQVTGGARVTQLRQTEVLWRLAYQQLRADLTGDEHYRPLSSVSKHWFTGQFYDFAQWAAEQHQLLLPENNAIDLTGYLQRAAQHSELVRRIELVRHLFRRPLELWLLLDKALFLQQHGYSVNITEFCDYQMTPRNLLLQARLNAASHAE